MDTIALLKQHRLRALGMLILIADLLFFGTTNPDNVRSLVLFSGFLLLTATFFYGAWAVLALASKSGIRIGVNERKAGLGIAGLLALLVALQSVGQLGVRDVMVVIPFAVLAYIYTSYNRKVSETSV